LIAKDNWTNANLDINHLPVSRKLAHFSLIIFRAILFSYLALSLIQFGLFGFKPTPTDNQLLSGRLPDNPTEGFLVLITGPDSPERSRYFDITN